MKELDELKDEVKNLDKNRVLNKENLLKYIVIFAVVCIVYFFDTNVWCLKITGYNSRFSSSNNICHY